ncbi:MAG: DUF4012 domain-containing protein [Patescibacteria group bacterium]
MHTPAFLRTTEPESIHRRNRRRNYLRALFVTVAVLVVTWLVIFFLAIGQIAKATFDVKQNLTQAREEALAFRFGQGREALLHAQQNVASAKHGFILLEKIWFIPGFAKPFIALEGTFDSTIQIIESLSSLFALGQDVSQIAGLSENTLSDMQTGISPHLSYKEFPTATKRAILERLSTSSHELDLLSSRIKIASDEFSSLRSNPLLAGFLGTLEPVFARMESLQTDLRVASVLSHVLPELAGLNTPRTHLLLFLNNDELRPGGGFIGTYGLMRVKDGDVVQFDTKDAYAIDSVVAKQVNTIPPTPLQTYNATSKWFFRDGNWSPDFSLSARQVSALFEQESALLPAGSSVPSSTEIDSVIGFTPTLASTLLAYLGPIEVGGQTFTSKNVPELIEFEVEKGFQQNGIPYDQRKEILADLVSQIQERLMNLPFSKWGDVFPLISQAIETKQLALYSANPQIQKTISEVNWGGVVSPTTVDSQLFVDANLASLKSDPVVSRAITYKFFRNESGKWIGRTTIKYHHAGSFDWRTTRYRSYARLYVPKGSTLIRTMGSFQGIGTDVSEELGMSVFGTFVTVEPGKDLSLIFEYTLADSVVEAIRQQTYNLTVFKQMGARLYPLTLDLDFDKNITHAVPAESRAEWGNDSYRLNTKLDQDSRFDIGL